MYTFGCNATDMVLVSKFISEGKLVPSEDKPNKWVFKTDENKKEFIDELIREAVEGFMDQINEISFSIHTK